MLLLALRDGLDSIDSSSSSSSDGDIAQCDGDTALEPLDVAIDKVSEFHVQSGIVDKTWVLFDSDASADGCPNSFAEFNFMFATTFRSRWLVFQDSCYKIFTLS